MADELKFRVTGDTGDAVTEVKRLQAEIASFNAAKLKAEFNGAKEEAKAAGDAIKKLQVDLAGLKATALRDKHVPDAQNSSRIMKEAFETGASEIIESWGVDGDIANEL